MSNKPTTADQDNQNTQTENHHPNKEKPTKPIKVPKVFGVTMSAFEVQKKILRYMYTKKERDFIRELYKMPPKDELPKKLSKKNPGPLLTRPLDLTKLQKQQLKALAKDINNNRGLFAPVKTTIILTLLGGSVAFGMIFQNQIIQNAFETNLTNIVGAPAVFDGFRVRLFNTGVWFDRLQIADTSDPTKNAVDLRGAVIDMDTDRLLRGAVHIRNFGIESLELGTPRQVSAQRDQQLRVALEQQQQADAQRRAEQAGEDPVLQAMSQWFNLDPSQVLEGITGAGDLEALAQQELARLDTPQIVQDQIQAMEDFIDEQTTRIDGLENRINQLDTQVRGLATNWNVTGSNFQSLTNEIARTNDVTRIPGLTNQAQALISGTQQLTQESLTLKTQAEQIIQESQVLVGDIQTFTRSIQGLPREIEARVTADFQSLEARARELVSLTLDNPLETLVVPLLSNQVLEYLQLYQQARGILEDLMASNEPGQAIADGSPRDGRVVRLDPQEFPRFLLSRGFFSFQGRRSFGFELTNIASEPRRISQPPRVRIFYDQGPEALDLVATFRPEQVGTNTTIETQFRANQLAIPMNPGILPTSGLSGALQLGVHFQVNPQGQVSLSADISLQNQRFTRQGDGGLIGERLMAALESLDQMTLGVSGSPAGLELESNIAQVLATEAENIAREQLQQLIGYFERELDQLMAPYLAELTQMQNQINQYLGSANNLASQASGLDQQVAVIQNQIQHEIRRLEQEVQNAAQRALPGVPVPNLPAVPVPSVPVPAVPTPSLPSLPGRR
jgi:archaellum component FlaC